MTSLLVATGDSNTSCDFRLLVFVPSVRTSCLAESLLRTASEPTASRRSGHARSRTETTTRHQWPRASASPCLSPANFGSALAQADESMCEPMCCSPLWATREVRFVRRVLLCRSFICGSLVGTSRHQQREDLKDTSSSNGTTITCVSARHSSSPALADNFAGIATALSGNPHGLQGSRSDLLRRNHQRLLLARSPC